jgi:predicted GIY-YIG superfamily endonuclease
MKPFWVYILKCSDESFYVGHTDELEKRIAEHETGATEGYTKSRRPVTIIYTADFSTREDALSFERQIKGWSRKKKEALIKGDWDEVKRLARNRSVKK